MTDGPTSPVTTIPINRLRRDSALIVRGMLLLAIIPGGLALLAAAETMRGQPSFELTRLLVAPILVPLVIFLLTMFVLRRVMGRLNRTALQTLFYGYALLALAVAIAAVWGWSRIESPVPWAGIADKFRTDPVLWFAVALLLALSSWLAWYAVISPLRAARRMLSARLPDGRPLIGAMDGIRDAVTVPGPQPSAAARAVRAGATVTALALGIAMALVVVWLFSRGEMIKALLIEFVLLAVIIGLMRFGHRFAAVDAAALQAVDPRPPVLFLRSFKDDVGKLEGEWGAVMDVPEAAASSAAGRAVSSALDVKPLRALGSIGVPRMEEVIAAEVGRLGPFVAIGAPDEPLPQLGATRAYYDNDTWQTAIQRWIDMAQLIVKVAGPTKWIRWELGHIIDQGAVHRLLVIFPALDAAPDRAERWRNMASCFAGTEWRLALDAIDPARVLALRFRPGGRVEVITDGAGRGLDVILAVRILLDGMSRDRVLVASPSASSPAASPSTPAAS